MAAVDILTSPDTINGGLPAWRLNLLRVGYALIAFALGVQVWPGIIQDHGSWKLMQGVVQCMLGALSLVALLGLRQPLRMLPLLMFEVAWKVIWLTAVALPKQLSGQMDENTWSVTFACLMVVIFPVIIPWGHLIRTYFGGPGARWR